MDDEILPQADEFSYTDNPSEEINKVFRRESIDKNIPLNELAFNDTYKN